MRLPLLDAGGSTIGRIEDIVVIPGSSGANPRVLGFVADSQRRRIFVNAARIGSLDSDGGRVGSWGVDPQPFKPPRAGGSHISANAGQGPGARPPPHQEGPPPPAVVGAVQGPPRPPLRAGAASE